MSGLDCGESKPKSKNMDPLKYFKSEDHTEISQARSLSDILKVAMNVLVRMPEDPVFQVCGPISTGQRTFKENHFIFTTTIDIFYKNKIEVFNQMPFEAKMGELQEKWKLQNPNAHYYMPLLDEFYKPIFETGKIKKFIFIPGWEHSFGAMWEHEQGKRLGIEMIYLHETWVIDFNIEPVLKLLVA